MKTAEQWTIIQQYGDWYTGRWWVGCYIWYSVEGPGRAAAPPSPHIAVPNVTAHPSTASVPTLYYSMRHYNCLWILKGLRVHVQSRRVVSYRSQRMTYRWDDRNVWIDAVTRRRVRLRRLRSHDDVAERALIGRWGRTVAQARWGDDGGSAWRQDWSGVNLFRLHATLDLHVTFHYRPALTERPRRRMTDDRRPALPLSVCTVNVSSVVRTNKLLLFGWV